MLNSRWIVLALTAVLGGAGCTKPSPSGNENGSATGGSSSISDPGSMMITAPNPDLCPDGRARCGDICADTLTDPAHCGQCDQACEEGFVCNGGSCEPGGDCTETPCAGFSYCDLVSKVCKRGCASDDQCEATAECDLATHACICREGFHDCSGVCSSDESPSSCGTSCTPCSAPADSTPTCVAGACSYGCNAGTFECGGQCYPGTGESPVACGPNCTACAAPVNATATCDSGQCSWSCNSGYVECGGQCFPGTTAEAACGANCSPCQAPNNASASCTNNVCDWTCGSGFVECGGACHPGTSADDACGANCQPCVSPAHGTSTCTNNACKVVCEANHILCGDKCGSLGACQTDADCCSDICFNGQCAYTYCETDVDCPNSYCEPLERYCAIDCVEDTDCPQTPGAYCNGICFIVSCENDADCPGDMFCNASRGNSCTNWSSPCTTDAHCTAHRMVCDRPENYTYDVCVRPKPWNQ